MENSDKPQGRTSVTEGKTPNVAKIFIQWKSKNKSFSYYNKEKKEDVLLPMPFSFVPLKICHTVKGYNHKKNKTFIANEVADLGNDILTVTSYNNVTKEKKQEYKGIYADIKEDFDQNVKFTESVYAAIKNKKGEYSIVNIQLNGGGLTHWYDFIKENDISSGAVKVTKFTTEKNGDVDFFAPKYELSDISKEDDIKCGELQRQVAAYLKEYFAKNETLQVKSSAENKSKSEPKSTPKNNKNNEEVADEEGEDITFDPEDDDLPF